MCVWTGCFNDCLLSIVQLLFMGDQMCMREPEREREGGGGGGGLNRMYLH